MNKNDIIALVLWILILAFVLLVLTKALISQKTEKTYTYTKAFCDTSNTCQDYEVRCEDGEVVSVVPVTGASIDLEKNWLDPRAVSEEEIKC
jgi:hypothetical protein